MRLLQKSKSPLSSLSTELTGARKWWPRSSPLCRRSCASQCTGKSCFNQVLVCPKLDYASKMWNHCQCVCNLHCRAEKQSASLCTEQYVTSQITKKRCQRKTSKTFTLRNRFTLFKWREGCLFICIEML